MAETRVSSNKYFGWVVFDATDIADISAITVTEFASGRNISDAVKFSGTDHNTKASSSEDDRSFADAATAKESGDADFGGNFSGFKAQPTDTSSNYWWAEQNVKPAGKDLIVVGIPVLSNSGSYPAGTEYDAWHVLTDAPTDTRGTASYSWTSVFLPQSDIAVRGIIAPASPVAPTIAVAAGEATGAPGDIVKLKATYQGVNITIGATWTSSDESIATVTPHGIVEMITDGTADITASFPGAAAATAVTVTVSGE